MTSQEKKEALWKAGRGDKLLSRLYTKVDNLYEQATSMSVKWGSEKVKGGKSEGMEGILIRLADELTALSAQQTAYFELVRNVQHAIESLPSHKQREVITYRYFDGLKWEEIADRMGTELTSVYKLHGRALQNLKI